MCRKSSATSYFGFFTEVKQKTYLMFITRGSISEIYSAYNIFPDLGGNNFSTTLFMMVKMFSKLFL